ncbi:hypothetical protein GCM10027162_10590 [Streptomyces incanus]
MITTSCVVRSSRATRSSIEAKRAALSGARPRKGWVLTAVLTALLSSSRLYGATGREARGAVSTESSVSGPGSLGPAPR